jgi:cytochrome b561
LQEVKPEVEQKAQEAADVASKAAIWSFIALMLGVITTGIGGKAGEPDDIYMKERKTIV